MDGAFNVINYCFCGLHLSSLSNSSPLHLSLHQHRSRPIHHAALSARHLPSQHAACAFAPDHATLLAPQKQYAMAHATSHHASVFIAERRLGPTSLEQRLLPTVAQPHPWPHLASSVLPLHRRDRAAHDWHVTGTIGDVPAPSIQSAGSILHLQGWTHPNTINSRINPSRPFPSLKPNTC